MGEEPGNYFFRNEGLFSTVAFPIMEKLYKQKRLCDVVLKMGDKRIEAHRIVLTGSIPYFHSMFTIGMSEINLHEIVMSGIEPNTFKQLIDYAYSGEIQINKANVFNILEGASFLQIMDVFEAVVDFLQGNIDVNNAVDVRIIGDRLASPRLKTAADAFIAKNFKPFCENVSFLQLELEDLVDIIQRDDLYVKKEEEVYEAAIKWLKYDIEDRGPFAGMVMKHVRLAMLQIEFLNEVVDKEKIFTNQLDCVQHLIEAKNYHLFPHKRLSTLSKSTTARDYTKELFVVSYGIWGRKPSFEVYCPYTESWRKMEPNFTNRPAFGVAAVPEKLMLIGGNVNGVSCSIIESFMKRSNVWVKDMEMVNPRENFGTCLHNDNIYICGGRRDDVALETVEFLSLKDETWYNITTRLTGKFFKEKPMHQRRDGCKCVVIGNIMYVVGGGDQNLGSCEALDFIDHEWVDIAPLIIARISFGISELNGKIYVYGGYDGQESLDSVEVYDPSTNDWSFIKTMNYARFGGICCSFMNKLFIMGGNDNHNDLSSVEVYDPEDDEWNIIEPMKDPKWYGGAGIL